MKNAILTFIAAIICFLLLPVIAYNPEGFNNLLTDWNDKLRRINEDRKKNK